MASNCGALGGDGLRRLYLQRWKHCVQEKAVSHTEVSSKAASSGHLLSALCQRKQGGASRRTRRAGNKARAEVEKVEKNSQGSKEAEGELCRLEGGDGAVVEGCALVTPYCQSSRQQQQQHACSDQS